MRTSFVVGATLIGVLLTGCTPASAHSLDPQSDLDCALTSDYFHEMAVQHGAPEKQTFEMEILAHWFTFEFQHKGIRPSQADLKAISNSVLTNPAAARQEADACVTRATDDERFMKFARLAGWRP